MNYNPIIIPSKHIYGQPTYNTYNNIINNVEWEENKLNNQVTVYGDQKKVTLFTVTNYPDKKATYMNGTTPIEFYGYSEFSSDYNNSEINDFANTTTLLGTAPDQYFKTTVDFDLTNMIISENFLSDLQLSFGLEFFAYKPIYDDSGTEVGQFLYGTNYSSYIYDTKKTQRDYLKIENARIENNVLFLDIIVAYKLLTMPISYSVSLYGVNYKSNYYKKLTGTKTDIILEKNELLSADTKTSKYNYNPITYHNELGLNERKLYVTSKLPVASDITIRVSYYSISQEPNYIDLTINKGSNKSQTISISLLQIYGDISDITPKYDETYGYYYGFVWSDENVYSIGEIIANNIISNYNKGKKRINLKVGYGDYYYADGTPYGGTSGKKKLLQVGDLVQPMQYKNGKDVPFITKKDGSPMIFEITNAELDTNGAPKLSLQLLEKTT